MWKVYTPERRLDMKQVSNLTTTHLTYTFPNVTRKAAPAKSFAVSIAPQIATIQITTYVATVAKNTDLFCASGTPPLLAAPPNCTKNEPYNYSALPLIIKKDNKRRLLAR